MFIGHYAASLALKRFERRASLGLLFLAVQFVDILFFPLVVLGLERINLIENYTQSTHFELEYMPYTQPGCFLPVGRTRLRSVSALEKRRGEKFYSSGDGLGCLVPLVFGPDRTYT